MADKAHRLTDEKLEEMEKRLSAIYSRAEKEIQKTADEYFSNFYNADKPKSPASVTKILNAIVTASVFDNYYVTVNDSDIEEGSGVALSAGERISTKEALYRMMLVSDNDAGMLLARDFGKRVILL